MTALPCKENGLASVNHSQPQNCLQIAEVGLKTGMDGYFCTLLHLVPVRWLGAAPKTKPTDRHTDYFSVENYMEKYYPCQSKSHDCWYTQ